jgi:hypothetical protein
MPLIVSSPRRQPEIRRMEIAHIHEISHLPTKSFNSPDAEWIMEWRGGKSK